MPHLELFPFRFLDARTGRWIPARYRATREQLEARFPGAYQVTGAAEVREAGGGTAGHLQSSPAPSGSVPSDLAGAAELVRSGPGTGSAEGEGGSPCGDDPRWGRRLLP